ncbi:MAG: hypothetical protein ACK51L_03035 [bacterium]
MTRRVMKTATHLKVVIIGEHRRTTLIAALLPGIIIRLHWQHHFLIGYHRVCCSTVRGHEKNERYVTLFSAAAVHVL